MNSLLTVSEVADCLKVSKPIARQWIKDGLINHIALPGAGTREIVRVSVSTLNSFIEAHERGN